MADILLESGTNEVELLEFNLMDQHFGLNVAKVCQMIRFSSDMLTRVPLCHEFVLGSVNWMEKHIPLIDLTAALGDDREFDVSKEGILLVVEVNSVPSAFVIDGVNRIHRISWADIEPLNPMIDCYDVPFTGTVTVEGRDVLLLDIEKILIEISPPADYLEAIETAKSMDAANKEDEGDASVFKIMIAEDSHTIRQILKGRLKKEGFEHIEDFDSGSSILARFTEINEEINEKRTEISDYVNLLISDIEMPGCDGLTLCKKIKSDMKHNLPVLLCSSLVNESLVRKCKAVNADDYVTKREPAKLMELVHMYADAHKDGVEVGSSPATEETQAA